VPMTGANERGLMTGGNDLDFSDSSSSRVAIALIVFINMANSSHLGFLAEDGLETLYYCL